ncbi:MAG: hypothetical protein R2729_30825 [Bryobacteraceae bacterium]
MHIATNRDDESARASRVKPRDIGLKLGLSYDSVSLLIEIGERPEEGPPPSLAE